tara:strand:- start:35117 stop:40090 length:4974 start_codon:yes stop_codon:yes gene_type:complete
MRNIEYNKILNDTTSFQLVRTNPKLTSNVKLTINQYDEMWLDSIEVSSELADDKYKRFRVNPEVSHPANLYNFYDSGKTPNEIAFSLSENVSTVKTSKDYKDQYDFSEYFSGARYFPSKQYTERLSYFAPIYLKQDLPEYFVIFKIENPLNYRIDDSESSYPFEKGQYIIDMLKKSTIIKTYDLTESSKVGSYLRKHVSDPSFPKGGLTVDYNKDTFTKFNGILIDSGAFGSRSELLSDFYSSSTPLKHFEQFITKGYERNGVIYPNIMNIEFIFDDETSEYYDFNRYLGVYINKVELDKISADIDRVYNKRATWLNTPRLRRNVKEYEEVAVIQKNPNGVIFPYKQTQLKMSEFNDSYSTNDKLYMNYINDKHGNLYSFKLNNNPIIEDIDSSSNELTTGKIKLSKKEINLGDFFGPGRDFLQDEAFSTNNPGYSNSYLKILSELKNGDVIKFYHPTGTKQDSSGKYDDIIATVGYSLVPNSGDFYFYNDIDNVVGHDTFYFNATGLPNEIASAIKGCLDNIRSRTFRITLIDEYLFIRSSSYGNYDDRYGLEYQSPSLDYSNIEIAKKLGNDLIGNIFRFEGGSSFSGNRIIMKADQRQRLEENINDVIVKTENGWSKIKKISNYIDTIEKGYHDYFDKISILLELEEKPFIRFGEVITKLIHRPSFGLLSFLPIRDFDFDFYSSKYLNFPINDLYQFYYIPDDTNILEEGISYQVYGNGKIQWNGNSYSSPDVFQPGPGDELFYTVSSGDPIVSFANVNLNGNAGSSIIPYNDENKEIKDFEGFFLLKDPSKVTPEEDNEVFKRKQKYLNGATQTEYDYYKENFTKDFSLESKLIPYITKWSLLNGKDSRNNPYRLNNELAFGFNNFSPSHDDTTQNPSNFTHEWFYLESKFNYTEDKKTVTLNNSYFDIPLDENKLLNEEDYFIKYFTYTPTLNSIEVGETQTRYSIITKNQVNQFETFLKGFKLNFKDVINENDIGPDGKPVASQNTTRFENYKFSCILKTFKEDINSDDKAPIKYRVVEHKDFKFILVIIELRIGSEDEIHDFWKELSLQPSPAVFNVNRSNFLDLDPSGFYELYDTINGDYRIKFKTDLSTNLDISNITYSLLYSLKHKKVNNFIDNYSNIKLTPKLDLSSSGAFLSGGNEIEKIENINASNYPQSISDELSTSTLNLNTFIIPRFKIINKDYFIRSNSFPNDSNPFIASFDEGLICEEPAARIYDGVQYISNIPTGTFAAYQLQYTFKAMVSGANYYEKIIEKLSFARFKQYVNELNSFIEYESWKINSLGQAQQLALPNYYIEIPDNESIIKKQGLAALIDSNRPSNFSFINDIGYNYFTSNLDNTYEINRYKGTYEPIFTDVIFFNSKYIFDQTKNNIKEIDLANISLNVNIDSFGTIENFSHIKISPTKILDLEADDSFEPRYELIDEIAISKKPYFLFGSNWEFGYHHKYKDKSNSKPAAGTLRIEEDDSFIGKLINLPNEVDLENFNILELSELELLENVNLDQIEIVSKETSTGIEGYINLNNILSRYFIENGISNSFYQYLVNQEKYIGSFESIDKYIEQYIKLNILKLYETKELFFYTKQDRTLKSKLQTPINSNNIEFISLNDNQRNEQGFFINKNLEINKYERLILSFSFNKNNESGTLVSPKIKMKFI